MSLTRDGLCQCGCGKPTTIASRNIYRNGVQEAVKGEPYRYRRGHNPRLYHPGVIDGRGQARRMYALRPCDRCGGEARDRHHADGDCRNNDPANIQILCRRCHMQVDGRSKGGLE